MKISTKRGDGGETGLLYGGRVPKSDLRCEAYGATDEAISALGLARALCHDPWVREFLKEIQRDLFTLGAELATSSEHYALFLKHFSPVTSAMIDRLDEVLGQLEAAISLPRSFIIPGASPGSAALDVGRSTLRRSERRTVDLHERGAIANPDVLRYLNRLSDVIFMLARYEDRHLPLDTLTGDSQ